MPTKLWNPFKRDDWSKVGNEIEDAADDVGDAIKDTAEDVGDKIKDTAEDAGKKLEPLAEQALGRCGGGPSRRSCSTWWQ